MTPPKPKSRTDKVSLWRYARLFRQDILSAQPERLYRAWMAEFRTPFFRSYLINQPDLIRAVLNERPRDFPKSDRIGAGLRPLLGNSVFVTNGAVWAGQRRIIDPAFEGGRLRDTYPSMWAAGLAGVKRMRQGSGPVEIEEIASFVAADVIFRTLFSIPIEDALASEVFTAFRAHQRSQPILNLAAFIPGLPGFMRRDTRVSARRIRRLIMRLTRARAVQIADGTAPDDLATKIMTTPDPQTGKTFTPEEMVDQVAIFFLAGHETSASALAWSLYMLATHPDWQDRCAREAAALGPEFGSVSQLRTTRDVFRETLRLYPPVPMMVREAKCPVQFRGRDIKRGAQIVISPWHLHRQSRLWEHPDAFMPERWHTENGKTCARDAYLPFSSGSRVCPGAGFAMVEGVMLLGLMARTFRFAPVADRVPVPQAHLTVRAKDGIWLSVQPRDAS